MHPLLNDSFTKQLYIGDGNGNYTPFNGIQEITEVSDDEKKYDGDFAARMTAPFATVTFTVTDKYACRRLRKIFKRDTNRARRIIRRCKRAKEKARRMKLKGEIR